MFDSSLVVQSAISTFNNIALRAPDFFWTAIFCLPIFAVFWVFRNEISARFFPDTKKRTIQITTLILGFIGVWLLTHENFAALRDGIWIGTSVLTAICIFVLSVFAGQKLRSFSDYVRVGDKWKNRSDYLIPWVILAVVGLCAMPQWWAVLVQFCAAAAGFYLGRLRKNRGKATISVENLILGLVFILTAGLVMQPEFFRFGWLGNLTIIHLIFITGTMFFATGALMLRVVRPTGWLKPGYYNKFIMLMRAMMILLFAMFVLTESILMFGIFVVAMMCYMFLVLRHRAKSMANKTEAENMWFLAVLLFGVLISMPVIVCAMLLIGRKIDVVKSIRALL
ncbi:MAG: hypothetical protein LBL75_04070 [Rickettsiales bacterium]|jgi:hypothetical protein|nr:hypothetical protein [Rickettsiales bacterium]